MVGLPPPSVGTIYPWCKPHAKEMQKALRYPLGPCGLLGSSGGGDHQPAAWLGKETLGVRHFSMLPPQHAEMYMAECIMVADI